MHAGSAHARLILFCTTLIDRNNAPREAHCGSTNPARSRLRTAPSSGTSAWYGRRPELQTPPRRTNSSLTHLPMTRHQATQRVRKQPAPRAHSRASTWVAFAIVGSRCFGPGLEHVHSDGLLLQGEPGRKGTAPTGVRTFTRISKQLVAFDSPSDICLFTFADDVSRYHAARTHWQPSAKQT